MSEDKQAKKGKKVFIFIGIAAVVLIAVVINYILGANYEKTDNAQIDADIVPIRSSVGGYVKTIHFTDNQLVKKGDLLITIDDTELKAKVAQAEAALENAKANLAAVKTNAIASGQNADAASMSSETTQQSISIAKTRLAKLKEDYKRIKNMYDDKAATKAELDNIKAEVDVAEAQYLSAQNQFKASSAQSMGVRSQAEGQKSMIALAEALVRQREAELVLAKTQLDYATIEAPCDGVVSKRSVEVGQFITAGQPLCSTIDNTHLWITANFKETQVNKIHPGQTVEVEIDAYPGMTLHGHVESYIGATGAKFSLLPPDNSTGNFVKIVQRVPLKIALDNLSKDEIAKLFPGLSAFVTVKIK